MILTINLTPRPEGRYAVTVTGPGNAWFESGSVREPEEAPAWAMEQAAGRKS
jgi:hypothetical protein